MLWSSSTGLAVTDRGLQYGDGLFETLLVVATQSAGQPGNLWLLDEHLDRLRRGCATLGIGYPSKLLQAQLPIAVAQVEEGFAVLKLLVSAQGSKQGPNGTTMRGYARESMAEPNLHCSLHAASSTPLQTVGPVRARVTQTLMASQPRLAGVKHLNRLEQVLARLELESGDFEGVMLNAEQGVVECTSSNLFADVDGQLCTPPLERCGVAGVLRQRLLAEYPKQIAVRPISLDELRGAQEVFLTNSVYGVRTVGELVSDTADDHWRVGYHCGPWFMRVQALLKSQIKALALASAESSFNV